MSAAFVLDILVAALLVATIAYAVVLNRRLSQLRGGREQMERLISDLYQATTHAEAGVSALREATSGGDSGFVGQLDSLTKLRDELDFLVGRAEAQSARLEELIGESRGQAAPPRSDPASIRTPDAALDDELFGGPDSAAEAGEHPQQAPASSSIWNLAAREELQ